MYEGLDSKTEMIETGEKHKERLKSAQNMAQPHH